MKNTFKIVPTNYIVWQTGLIPNFGPLTYLYAIYFFSFLFLVEEKIVS